MSNAAAAQQIGKMTAEQKSNFKASMIKLIFRCLAVICLLVVIGLFLKMNDEQTELNRFIEEGMVSRGFVIDKSVNTSTATYSGRRGRQRNVVLEHNMLYVTYDPESTIPYADLDTKLTEADLPPPAQLAPQSDAISNGAAIILSDEGFAKVNIDDTVTLVRTPYGDTTLVSEVRDYSTGMTYSWMAALGVLSIALWFIGGLLSHRRR